MIVLGGEQAVAATRLEYEDGSGRTKVLAEGAGLVKLAVLTRLRSSPAWLLREEAPGLLRPRASV